MRSSKPPNSTKSGGQAWEIQFLDDLQFALNKIASNPDGGILYEHGTKMVMLAAFPYRIIYRDQADHVGVFAVMHHSRRPGYWADRLEDE